MREITVPKNELIDTLAANREAHRGIVEEAWEGYKRESVRLLEDQLDRARRGDRKRIYVSLEMPADHTADYDRVIAMLEMDVDDHVALSEQDFSNYVQDDWGWKQQWTTTNSAYVAGLS